MEFTSYVLGLIYLVLYAKILETVAAGIQSGKIVVPKERALGDSTNGHPIWPNNDACGILLLIYEGILTPTQNCTVAWVLTYRNNVAAMALYSSVGGTEGADDSGPSNTMLGYSFALTDASKRGPSS